MIVVMGSLHFDLMVDAAALPRLGETALGTAWRYKPGGKGGNQAVAAARQGARVAMLGLVGEDDFGMRLREHLEAAQVDARGVASRAGVGTGFSVAITEATGDYGAVIVSGVNVLLDAAMLEPHADLLAGCSGLLLQNEVPEAANLVAATAARAGGGRVILNAAPARALSESMWAGIDVLIVNALEAGALCGFAVGDLPQAVRAAACLAATVPWAVVTAGGAGLAASGPGAQNLALPAHAVPVVSTHGAGDAFVGALAARLDAGHTMESALRHANAAAALVVATPDDERAQLDAARVAQFMRESGVR